MAFKEIDLLKTDINPFRSIGSDWCLITSGDKRTFNTMTASWGGMGIMWNKNVATIVIRPQRYTMEFLKKNDKFTISFFDEKDKGILKYCGANSGRDVDKVASTGLIPFEIDNAVSFQQAKTVLVCKKLYAQSLDPDCFIDKSLLSNYANNDYHVAIVGEILQAINND